MYGGQPVLITAADAAQGVVHNVATATGSCGCSATVLAAHAAAIVPTTKVSTPATVVPGLPFTGAMGVGLGRPRRPRCCCWPAAFLLLLTRRRRDEDGRGRLHRAL